nr:hypothetical protein [Abalone asfa-like virus]
MLFVHHAKILVYWLVICCESEDSDFQYDNFITLINDSVGSSFNIISDKKLYILLEKPKLEDDLLVFMYNTTVPLEVMIHDLIKIPVTNRADVNITIKENQPTKNITMVLLKIPKEIQLPSHVWTRFYQKYKIVHEPISFEGLGLIFIVYLLFIVPLAINMFTAL